MLVCGVVVWCDVVQVLVVDFYVVEVLFVDYFFYQCGDVCLCFFVGWVQIEVVLLGDCLWCVVCVEQQYVGVVVQFVVVWCDCEWCDLQLCFLVVCMDVVDECFYVCVVGWEFCVVGYLVVGVLLLVVVEYCLFEVEFLYFWQCCVYVVEVELMFVVLCVLDWFVCVCWWLWCMEILCVYYLLVCIECDEIVVVVQYYEGGWCIECCVWCECDCLFVVQVE